MLTRRSFLKYTASTVLTWFAFDRFGVRQAIAEIPRGSLDPRGVPKFETPLLIPPVMPRAAKIARAGKNVDYYEISMKPFHQQILPAGLPATPVWGYGAVSSASRKGVLLHHAPSLTIEAKWDTPVRVKWINDLKGRGWQLRTPSAARRSDAALGEPARRRFRARHANDFHGDARSVRRAGAHRHARAWCGGRG